VETSDDDKLTAKDREAIPAGDFALPSERKYPIHDEVHARNALARVSQFGSDDEKAKVRAAVKKKYPGIDLKASRSSEMKTSDLKPNLVAISQAKNMISRNKLDHGKDLSADVAKSKPMALKFAAVDDSKGEDDPEHYQMPIYSGDSVSPAAIKNHIKNLQTSSDPNHELTGHLQSLDDAVVEQHTRTGGLPSGAWSRSDRAFILSNAGETLSAARADQIPAGLPDTVNGEKVVYRWKESLPVNRDIYDQNGVKHFYSREDAAKMVDTFRAAKAKGFVSPLPEKHREPGGGITGTNYGFVTDVRQADDGNLHTLCQLFERTLPDAMQKFSSICVAGKYRHDDGTVSTNLIDHNAIVPDPKINALGEFTQALAASRGTGYISGIDVAQFSSGADMDLTATRSILGDSAKGLDDAKVMVLANQQLAQLKSDLAAARSENATLQASRGAAGPSDEAREGFAYGIDAKAALVNPAKSGIMQPVIDGLKRLLIQDGKANVFAMSRSVGETSPIGVKVFELLSQNVVPPEYGSNTGATLFSRAFEGEDEFKKQEDAGRKQGGGYVAAQVGPQK
jgi:hypothetical protein